MLKVSAYGMAEHYQVHKVPSQVPFFRLIFSVLLNHLEKTPPNKCLALSRTPVAHSSELLGRGFVQSCLFVRQVVTVLAKLKNNVTGKLPLVITMNHEDMIQRREGCIPSFSFRRGNLHLISSTFRTEN